MKIIGHYTTPEGVKHAFSFPVPQGLEEINLDAFEIEGVCYETSREGVYSAPAVLPFRLREDKPND